MRRPAIENEDLPLAVAWERLRAGYHRRYGRHQLADECDHTADWLQERLNTLLENQIAS